MSNENNCSAIISKWTACTRLMTDGESEAWREYTSKEEFDAYLDTIPAYDLVATIEYAYNYEYSHPREYMCADQLEDPITRALIRRGFIDNGYGQWVRKDQIDASVTKKIGTYSWGDDFYMSDTHIKGYNPRVELSEA